MKQHLFDGDLIPISPDIAAALGINHAAVLQQLHFLLTITRKAGKQFNFVEGHWWVYNSYEAWVRDYIKWVSRNTLIDVFADLENRGLVVSKQGVKSPFDRKKWYRIDYQKWSEFVKTIVQNLDDENAQNLDDDIDQDSADENAQNLDDDSTETTKRGKKKPKESLTPGKPAGTHSGEFTAAKFYLVSDARRGIFVKPFTKKAAESEAARLNGMGDYGFFVMKGSEINAAAEQYKDYTRKAPEKPPQAALEAVVKSGWNIEKSQMDVLSEKDWTQVNRILDAVALQLGKTRNQIVNDSTIAAQITHVYQQYRANNPDLAAPKSASIVIGAWNEYSATFTPPPQPAPAGQKKPNYQAPARNGVTPS